MMMMMFITINITIRLMRPDDDPDDPFDDVDERRWVKMMMMMFMFITILFFVARSVNFSHAGT